MLKRIPTPEEYELEKAYKALRLNGGSFYVIPKVLVSAASTQKPTFKIRRLKGASSVTKDREKAEKALRLNGG